jgi:hypothetical protein
MKIARSEYSTTSRVQENLTSGTRPEDQHLSANRWLELIKSMYSASSWLYKCSLLVGKVENLVDFLALSTRKIDEGPLPLQSQVYLHSNVSRKSSW